MTFGVQQKQEAVAGIFWVYKKKTQKLQLEIVKISTDLSSERGKNIKLNVSVRNVIGAQFKGGINGPALE